MPTPHETREAFADNRSFGIFARTFGFTRHEAIKTLAHAGKESVTQGTNRRPL